MLSVRFLCEKVLAVSPGILATLPKTRFPPHNPCAEGDFSPSIPTKVLYIEVCMCYYSICQRESRTEAAEQKGRVPHMSLLEDARNIQRKDPAARSVLEVILLYPGFHILVYHRIAHWLYEHGHFFPCPLGQPARPPQDRHRDSPRCPDRQVPVHRPRHGHRVRRDHRDRRQLHHLPRRDAGRHRQGHRQAPPHPGEQCADRRGHQGAGPGVYRR